jgi:KDO2-lipid IV(A) lauroyltransferase
MGAARPVAAESNNGFLVQGGRVLLSLVRDWFVYFIVRLFVCALQAMRPESCWAMARYLAVLFNDVFGVRRDVVDDNLRHAFPELSSAQHRELSRKMWEHLMLMVCEIALASRKIHETNWHDHITLRGKREFVELLLSSRPLVAVTGHFGNFEMAGYIAGLLGFPSFTIARTLDNRFLHRFLCQYRGATGQFIFPARGSAESARSVLRMGETLALLGDHYAGPKGCWVEFFGRPASCHKAFALFSLASGAPLIVLYAKRTDRPLQFEMGLVDIADPTTDNNTLNTVTDLTQWYNRHLERIVRDEPHQYWWLHRRWKDTRTRRRRERWLARNDMATQAQSQGPHCHADLTQLPNEMNIATGKRD